MAITLLPAHRRVWNYYPSLRLRGFNQGGHHRARLVAGAAGSLVTTFAVKNEEARENGKMSMILNFGSPGMGSECSPRVMRMRTAMRIAPLAKEGEGRRHTAEGLHWPRDCMRIGGQRSPPFQFDDSARLLQRASKRIVYCSCRPPVRPGGGGGGGERGVKLLAQALLMMRCMGRIFDARRLQA